jgi:hypothetical protein
MPLTPTPYLGLVQPADDEADWGDEFRANNVKVDTAIQVLAQGGQPVPTQIEMDYDTRSDDLPVYLGRAPIDADDDDPEWTVTRFYYDGDRLAHTEVRTQIAWTGRAAPLDPWPVT